MMYEELMRRKLVSRLYDGMTDEEKRTYLMLRNHSETMNAINGIKDIVEKNRHSWMADFGANVAGNAAFDGAVWLISKILKKF